MVSLEEVKKASEILGKIAHKTPLVYNTTLSEMTGNHIYLKMENLQRTGSFKLRGAYYKIASLSENEKKRGVVASSAGNHAQGVALAATLYGIRSTIVMPRHAPLSKIKATSQYGAKVVLHGNVYDEAYEEAKRIQLETKATFIHPFNDPQVIAGQGTIALEILEDLPDVEVVVVPIGGGGLIAGIAVAIKNLRPKVHVIGVQAKNMPSMAESLARGQLTNISGHPTIADGIAVRNPGDLTFEIVKHYVDDIVTVDEDEIASAILFLMERAKTVAEGAGAVSVAAVLNRLSHYKKSKIVALISGGNIDVNLLSRIINRGLVKDGRKIFLNTVIPDKPGTLSQLLQIIASTGANVLSVIHNREAINVPLGSAQVELELETAEPEQVEEIQSLLKQHHYFVNISPTLTSLDV
ncbi:threonine ammonia-lyase [Carboxydothermus hydrogenoformans]|uniref:L-threonine dehydratase catabolic TdcB n=1 Tax=Carboxydothermus hydrogenoformans (strain ATCC BAA-161 / DSM 6008 / Z-2901) TaxID=246194 RepID=Q3A9D1_CARHZ|nr:threonine ammonia-lyase [Carboxydothermus hydrogenoformans]ABB14414.1 threonine dehydratase [Carboxydothermus hydrogenoformans Z-2901]